MTTEEQANQDALWPEGTDVGGLRAMCYGLLANYVQMCAAYIGTANARGMIETLRTDTGFWQRTSEVAPAIRELLRQQDELGKAMDDAERESPGN